MNVLKYFGIERRRHKRHVVINTAWVRSADAEPCVCILWDISEGGARLAVADPDAVADECVVTLQRDEVLGTTCRVVWRSKEQIGLQFVSNAGSLLRVISECATAA